MLNATNTLESDRKRSEAEFHDRREQDRLTMPEPDFERKYTNLKFYAVVQRSRDYLNRWIEQNARGKRALDYCCGLGQISIELARAGAKVYALDISEESVRTAKRRLAERKLAGNTFVMDAENLAFEPNSFDAIVISGVLHHLDVRKAYPELARVLRPGGRIMCVEALGYNPVINLYRQKTPHLRTDWEKDHILTLKEIGLARKYFNKVQLRYFHLFSILAVPFRRTALFRPLWLILDTLDRVILRIPLVRLLAWQMLFELSEPIKSPGHTNGAGPHA